MSQEQPRHEEAATGPEVEPIKYGDLFHVSGQVAQQPILPEDAAAMESAETLVMGVCPPGGPGSIMQSAAQFNVHAGLVGPSEPVITDQIRVVQSEVDGALLVTESIGPEVIGQYVEQKVAEGGVGAVTIGDALEAAARCAGDQPVDMADAAAIEAAEKRALGLEKAPFGGLGSDAYVAAAWNAHTANDELMTTIKDVLEDASEKLEQDKAVTLDDAKEVVKAEMRNDPEMATTVGGVAEMMATAANLNQP